VKVFLFEVEFFDGAISVSAIQWLCNADRSEHNPISRLKRFFEMLYGCLVKGGKAALQFYPANPQQMELIVSSAMRCGFSGGLVVDYPNSAKAKKYFLVLACGSVGGFTVPKGLDGDVNEIPYSRSREVGGNNKRQKKGKRPPVKSKDWVLAKKEKQRNKGHDVKPDTKYTARRRKDHF